MVFRDNGLFVFVYLGRLRPSMRRGRGLRVLGRAGIYPLVSMAWSWAMPVPSIVPMMAMATPMEVDDIYGKYLVIDVYNRRVREDLYVNPHLQTGVVIPIAVSRIRIVLSVGDVDLTADVDSNPDTDLCAVGLIFPVRDIVLGHGSSQIQHRTRSQYKFVHFRLLRGCPTIDPLKVTSRLYWLCGRLPLDRAKRPTRSRQCGFWPDIAMTGRDTGKMAQGAGKRRFWVRILATSDQGSGEPLP